MNVGTEDLWRGDSTRSKWYETERGAKIACTRINKQFGNTAQYVVLTNTEFDAKHNPFVTVHSLMNGLPVQLLRSEVGGCCDPSTERYWTM